jgi:hypothetical protein
VDLNMRKVFASKLTIAKVGASDVGMLVALYLMHGITLPTVIL